MDTVTRNKAADIIEVLHLATIQSKAAEATFDAERLRQFARELHNAARNNRTREPDPYGEALDWAADEIERLTKINRDGVESHNYYLVKCSNLERRLELIKRYADERHADDHRMDTDTVLNDFFEATDDEIATQLYRSMCADGK
jgi:hypothetical protein